MHVLLPLTLEVCRPLGGGTKYGKYCDGICHCPVEKFQNRKSMLKKKHDNKPLSALPVSNVNWQKHWSEQEFTRYTKITFVLDGLILTSLINKDLLRYDHFVLSFSEGNGVLLGKMIISLSMNITMNQLGGASVIAKFHS